MPIRVIVPPEPFMTPADIPGSHAGNDAAVAAMIAAVVGQIDGPDGSLRRCLGPQTLELSLAGFRFCGDELPCPPIIPGSIVVKYLDLDGVSQTMAPSVYALYGDVFRIKRGAVLPSIGDYPYPVAIQYQAGYNGTPVADGGTGPMPPQVKQAVIMMVQHLKSMGAENLFLRAEEVEGVGRFEYTVSDQAENIIKSTADRLLAGLKVRNI